MSTFVRLGNLFVGALLHSPFHRVLGAHLALVTVTGRRSGRRYTTPVNVQPEGERLWIVSSRGRTWWRNLRRGGPVELLWRGCRYQARGEVIEEPEAVAAGLAGYLQRAPSLARYFGVGLDETGVPLEAEVARAAGDRVLVRLTLSRPG